MALSSRQNKLAPFLRQHKMAHFLMQYKMALSSRQYKMALFLGQYKMAHSLRPYKMAHSLRQYTVFNRVLFSFRMSCAFTVARQCSLCYVHKIYSLPCVDFLETHICSTIFCTDLLCPYYSSTNSIKISTRSHTQTDRLLPHKARFTYIVKKDERDKCLHVCGFSKLTLAFCPLYQ